MAAVSSNGAFGRDLSDALGLGGLRVRSIHLKVETGNVVTVEIKYMPDKERLYDVLKVIRAYEWRESSPEKDSTAIQDEYTCTVPATEETGG